MLEMAPGGELYSLLTEVCVSINIIGLTHPSVDASPKLERLGTSSKW